MDGRWSLQQRLVKVTTTPYQSPLPCPQVPAGASLRTVGSQRPRAAIVTIITITRTPPVRFFPQLLRRQSAVTGEMGKSFADPTAPVRVQRPG